jgi:hypothetical protein
LRHKLLKLALVVVEVTSVPLLVVALVYALTGYELLSPIGLIPRARLVHTDALLRVLAISLGLLHSYAGLVLLIARRVRSAMASKVLFILATLAVVVLAAVFVVLELSYQLGAHQPGARFRGCKGS